MPRPESGTEDRSDRDVFINCPFDPGYLPFLDAILFAVTASGFRPRCALEASDGGQVRIHKIYQIIEECRLGIHDVSRTELDPSHQLPRFNMPLELGIFLGAKRFGNRRQQRKSCLVMDREPFRYQKFMSDIAGQDISSHDGQPEKLIGLVRDWLSTVLLRGAIPSGGILRDWYTEFLRFRPVLCHQRQLRETELTFRDRTIVVEEWLKRLAEGATEVE